MIPVKDNIPRERFPLVTAIAIAFVAVAYLLSGEGEGLLALLLDVLFLGLLGPSVEGAFGRVRFGGFCVLIGLLALVGRSLAGGGSLTAVLVVTSAVTAAVLGDYVLLYPRARVLTLVPIPFFTTLVEVPAAIAIGVWLALQVGLDAAGLR
jgi:membrane associated rhomboid family serine protease